MLVSAMHITAGVFVNDDESGLHRDIWKWLEGLAPRARRLRAPPDGRGQRRRAPEVDPRAPRGHRAGDGGPARPRAMAAGVLRGVRRAAGQAGDREGDGDLMRARRARARGLGLRGAAPRMRKRGRRPRRARGCGARGTTTRTRRSGARRRGGRARSGGGAARRPGSRSGSATPPSEAQAPHRRP